jgi:TolB-like protein/DNA-binding winged helix-turn-helix (wHTH) protein/tetratricopeptide (TPR) repeat protein
MAMAPPNHAIYEFGPFRLESGQHLLLRDRQPVAIPPKAFEILTTLLDHRGALVSKEDLQNRVWPDTFVDENNLTQQISLLRRILGESPEEPQYIETVPRFGYRFIAPAQQKDDVGPQAGALAAAEEGLPAARSTRRRVLSWSAGSAVAIVLAILLTGLYLRGRRDSRLSAANPQRIRSLVVLPLTNLTGDPGQDYFVDAMTDSLTTDLAQIHELRVISGTSAKHYKGTKKTLPEIARELNVDGVVEGTVFRSGDHVRITAQLVDAPIDRHLWARSYERDLRDVIRMQDEVARDIVGEIKVNLTPQEQKRLTNAPPVDTEAYQLYLQGQYFETRATEDYLRKSISTLQASIAKDSNFAPAHAVLAIAYDALSTNGYAPPLTEFPKVKAELARALELDDSLAETHAYLGHIKLTFDWDWSGGENEIQRALELDPNGADAHAAQSQYLAMVGHFDEAIAEMRRTRELDPVGLDASLYVGLLYLMAKRYDESIPEFKKALELDPNFLPTHAEMALAYARAGKRAEASAEYEKTRSLMGSRQALVLDQWMAPVEILLGKRAEALKNAGWWAQQSAQRHIDGYFLAAFYAELGLKDRAFRWLEKGFEQRSPSMVYLKFDANFPEEMRADPRFQGILRRMKFPN